VAHIYYGNEARDRYGLPLRTSLLDTDAEVEALLTRDMAAWVGDMGGTGTVTFRAVRGLGRTGDHVLEVADSERADVIVTGTHQRHGLARLSAVSGVVLHYGHAAVACVPQPTDAVPPPEEIPSIRCVLIATDLSPLANSAIPYGYALLRDGGGEVWLLHVLPEEGRADTQHDRAEIVARLRQLVPAMALQHNIVTRIEVVQSADVARTICDTAERIAAHVICLTSHGRSGFARTLLGSVADAVMTQTRRPLFLLRSLPA
jgi:nucleotide-binding universal stress UspA family protein